MVFPNTPRKSRKPQLLTAQSFLTNESRAKSKEEARDKTTEVRSAQALIEGWTPQNPS